MSDFAEQQDSTTEPADDPLEQTCGANWNRIILDRAGQCKMEGYGDRYRITRT